MAIYDTVGYKIVNTVCKLSFALDLSRSYRYSNQFCYFIIRSNSLPFQSRIIINKQYSILK